MNVLEIRLRFYDNEPESTGPKLENKILLSLDMLAQGVLGLRQVGLSAELKAVELLKAAESLPVGWEPEDTGMVAVATDEQLKELVNDPDWDKLSPQDQIEMRTGFQFQKNFVDTQELLALRTVYAATDASLPPPVSPDENLPERAHRVSLENAALRAYARTLRRLWGVQAELPQVNDLETNLGEDRGDHTLVFLPPQDDQDRDKVLEQTSELLGIPIQDLFDMYLTKKLSVFRFPATGEQSHEKDS